MKPKLVILIAIVGMGILLLSHGTAHWLAKAVPLNARPDLPQGVFVARVYYDSIAALNKLAVYDLWEFNNLEHNYVLISLDSQEYLDLESQGWRIEVDNEHTANVTRIIPPFSTGYLTVEEIYARLRRLNRQYPILTELVTYGQSTCLAKGGCTTLGGEFLPGHKLMAFRISNEMVAGTSTLGNSTITKGEKPVMILLANIHAREIVTSEIAIRFIDHLLMYYGQDPDVTAIVDWHEIWIIPTANPDGHWLVELGAQASYDQGAFFQRKNANLDANNDGESDCLFWPPANNWQYGVDLNRNHSYAWGQVGASDDPCSQTYFGPGPASENEVDSLQSLIQALIPDQRGSGNSDAAPLSTTGILLTLHSFGDLVIWPWGMSADRAPNDEGLRAIGDKLGQFSGYGSCQAAECLYFTSGTTDDWAYGVLGIPAFTIEIGNRFMPEYTEINETLWPENLPSLLYAARIARSPYEIVLGPDIYDLQTTVSKQQEMLTISATADDRDHEDRTIIAASYSVDLPHWLVSTTGNTMAAADGSFDAPVEKIIASIPLETIQPGIHTLYVNGLDADGYWGIVGTTFVDIPYYHNLFTYLPFVSISSHVTHGRSTAN